jgi:hypothetical protein
MNNNRTILREKEVMRMGTEWNCFNIMSEDVIETSVLLTCVCLIRIDLEHRMMKSFSTE